MEGVVTTTEVVKVAATMGKVAVVVGVAGVEAREVAESAVMATAVEGAGDRSWELPEEAVVPLVDKGVAVKGLP